MPTNRFPGIKKTTAKVNFNYFEKFDIIATSFGSETVSGEQPDVFLTFHTSGLSLINEGTGVIEYSFNGY